MRPGRTMSGEWDGQADNALDATFHQDHTRVEPSCAGQRERVHRDQLKADLAVPAHALLTVATAAEQDRRPSASGRRAWPSVRSGACSHA